MQPSNVLMKLSPTGDTQLVVQIDEKNLGLIAVGQQALASADAFPKEAFAAEVVYINPGHRPAARLRRGEAARARASSIICART